ncbi:MAG TPA: ABC transporter ATP-binding protein [Solirubrobacterales bacterium]|jgi:NitT/TauT family transport system ATP-binding protein|nr:ABC transporter ATP-binding protein [Solirubrobacterales bacterium]
MLTKSGAPITRTPTSSRSDPAAGTPRGAVELRGAGHSFGDLRALERIDLSVPAAGVLGIVGPSGCGKSTLLEVIAGLLEPSDGTVAIGIATAAEERLAHCALMPQRDLLLPWLSALDNAALAPSIAGASRADARERARPHFRRLGLGGFEATRPAELSGGMRQRVAFLRTLMAGKPVLLLDEPFASLDAITRAEMQAWLAGVLAGDEHAVVLVTHDVEEALYLSDRVAVMTPRPGRIAAMLEVPSPRRVDRAAAVTSPEFVALRERALRALAGEAR